eukprot:scaffold82852_cov63-Phaeocystis_antarctica.AAC.3
MLSTLADCARTLASQQRPGGAALHGPTEMPCAAPQHGDSTTKATATARTTAASHGRVLRTRTSEARTSSTASGTIAAADRSVPGGAMARLARRRDGAPAEAEWRKVVRP